MNCETIDKVNKYKSNYFALYFVSREFFFLLFKKLSCVFLLNMPSIFNVLAKQFIHKK